MARQVDRLTARGVQTLAKPGRQADGGGLYLQVDKSGAKRWVFIYRRRDDPRRQSEMGLGGLGAVSLAEARDLAADARKLLAVGRDPLAEREAAKLAAEVAELGVVTFGALADDVIASLEAGWRNPKHRAQWRMTMEVYAAPLRDKAVEDVATDDVVAILKPIWQLKAETASRVRGRIEKVLDAAKAKGLRTGENPARWRGHLDHLLPKRQKLQRGHHPAMPWKDAPAFVARLRERPSISAYALEFVILTAARSGEVLRSVRDGKLMGARWAEIDTKAKVWTVPADRMKAGVEHRVPLTERAVAILTELAAVRQGEFIFPGQQANKPLSEGALELLMRRMGAKPATVHGFRSAFRDWAGETTSFPREIAEAALAHTVGDKVERAYRRGDSLERRRELMETWSRFLEGTPSVPVDLRS